MSGHRHLEAEPAPLEAIIAMREAYRREMGCQIVHDSYHERGFTDSYLLRVDGEVVGYGSVAGDPHPPREIVKELYVVPTRRRDALALTRRLIAVSDARWIETQTNDVLLTLMLFDCAVEFESDRILFADARTTTYEAPEGAVFRTLTERDRQGMFAHGVEPVGEWGIESQGRIVATGGLMHHYNPPYTDLYLEVAPTHRRRGYGSYLVQELERVCRGMGRIPAARCRHDNQASRSALQRAGMLPCARIVRGRIVP